MIYESENKPLVFICSPLAGNVAVNMRNARWYCRFVIQKGMIPFAPHLLYTQFLNEKDEAERELGLSFGLAMLDKCDCLWVFGGVASKGMKIEIEKAQELGLPTTYYDTECVEVSPFA